MFDNIPTSDKFKIAGDASNLLGDILAPTSDGGAGSIKRNAVSRALGRYNSASFMEIQAELNKASTQRQFNYNSESGRRYLAELEKSRVNALNNIKINFASRGLDVGDTSTIQAQDAKYSEMSEFSNRAIEAQYNKNFEMLYKSGTESEMLKAQATMTRETANANLKNSIFEAGERQQKEHNAKQSSIFGSILKIGTTIAGIGGI